MAFTINIKKKEYNIKFNYRLLFKANKKLGTKDENGNSQNDGAGILFTQVLEQEDDALVNIIQLVSGATENEALEAIENYIANSGLEDEEEAYGKIFEDLKEEMLNSGFFMKKVKKYIENLEKAVSILQAKKDEEAKQQAEAVMKLLEKMKKEILLSTAQEEA
ncbi:tail assembly chaperone [Vagococcus lutrae]|uniref:tail assembly chaperone n=1 Tax=Vagococcus lutrae TaxID=81947 RepID=UPI0028908098|nr:tail assembly chaperone [Vagococcus lutrae]MDT2816282.1 tail assembly chaperone [Vagococcus lutrae]